LAEPAKAWLFIKRGLSTREAVAATLTEYLVYAFSSAAIAVAALTYLLARFELIDPTKTGAHIILFSMATFLLVAAVAVLFRIYLIGAIIKGLSRLPLVGARFEVDRDELRRIEDRLLLVLRERPPRLMAITALELAAHGALVFEVYWSLGAMGLRFAAIDPLLIEGSVKFVSFAFFFIPTQVGASEAAYAMVFEALRLTAAAGFGLAFLRRLRSLVAAGAGLIGLSLLGRRLAD
ncbi:MAG: lysylphosphatidylglycerol synthase domain-containing protein, partial [Acidobacteriota bacterium]